MLLFCPCAQSGTIEYIKYCVDSVLRINWYVDTNKLEGWRKFHPLGLLPPKAKIQLVQWCTLGVTPLVWLFLELLCLYSSTSLIYFLRCFDVRPAMQAGFNKRENTPFTLSKKSRYSKKLIDWIKPPCYPSFFAMVW